MTYSLLGDAIMLLIGTKDFLITLAVAGISFAIIASLVQAFKFTQKYLGDRGGS